MLINRSNLPVRFKTEPMSLGNLTVNFDSVDIPGKPERNVINLFPQKESSPMIKNYNRKINDRAPSQTKQTLSAYNKDDSLSELLIDKLKTTHEAGYLSALLVIRIDNFRVIKENFGNAVGAGLIKLLSVRLVDNLRLVDVVEQISDDELGIVLDGLKSTHQVETITKHLIDNCSGMYVLENQRLHIQSSIGASLFPNDSKDPLELLRFARIALRQIESNTAHFHFFSQQHFDKQKQSFWIESELEQAIEEGRMVIHYQPQYALNSDQTIIGMEALIRMIDNNGQLIPPDQFISIAEENGMIIPIGHWVIRESCQQLKRWHDQGLTNLRIAVNVSPRQMNDERLIDVVNQAVAESGISFNDLELEITEQCIFEHLSIAEKLLKTLSHKGVRISLDDFGTGYSSLAYLARFPLNVMKLDRIFLENVPQDPQANRIVTAIIEMANKLGLEVIAEGIEEDEQDSFLEALGCQMGQGFGFSKPQAAKNIQALLATQLIGYKLEDK